MAGRVSCQRRSSVHSARRLATRTTHLARLAEALQDAIRPTLGSRPFPSVVLLLDGVPVSLPLGWMNGMLYFTWTGGGKVQISFT